MSEASLPPPFNAPAGYRTSPGIQPGVSQPVVIANKVIVFGPGGGVFVYSGTPALGNPPVAWMSRASVDPYGNVLPAQDIVSFNSGAGQFSQLTAGQMIVESATAGPTTYGLNAIKFGTAGGFDIADIETGGITNGSGLFLTGLGDTIGNPAASLALVGKLTVGNVAPTAAFTADLLTVKHSDGNIYEAGHLTLRSTVPNQPINTVAAQTITGCSAAGLSGGTYEFRAVVQYQGAQAASTANFSVSVPAASPAWISGKFYQATNFGSGAQTTALATVNSPTLSTWTWTAELEGEFTLTGTGTIALQGACPGAPADTWKVVNAKFILTPA